MLTKRYVAQKGADHVYARNGAFDWARMIKRVVARFARGNIPAQEGRILLPEEQVREHAATREIARAWKRRV